MVYGIIEQGKCVCQSHPNRIPLNLAASSWVARCWASPAALSLHLWRSPKMHRPAARISRRKRCIRILTQGGRLLFISGQGPEDLDADMETQVRQTFNRIGILLKAAGAGFEHVAIVRSYWVHMLRDLPIYRKVRKDYLVKPYPASTAVGTPELAIPGLELEIEVVAQLP